MGELVIRTAAVRENAQQLEQWAGQLVRIDNQIAAIRGGLGMKMAATTRVSAQLGAVCEALDRSRTGMRAMRGALEQAASQYTMTEMRIMMNAKGIGGVLGALVGAVGGAAGAVATGDSKVADSNWMLDFGLKALGKFGLAGSAFDYLKSAGEGDLGGFLKDGIGLVGDYAEFALDPDATWKDLFGLDGKDVQKLLGKGAKEATDAKKVVGSIATWVGTGVEKFVGNYEEFNGDLSKGRFWSETAVETVVDVAIGAGAKVVAGAAIGAVATAVGITSVPAVVVGIGAVAVVKGVDAIVTWATGNSEWKEALTDGIVDFGEKAVEVIGDGVQAVGKGIQKAGEAVAGWFGSLFK